MGGMDYGAYIFGGLYRGYYRDAFPHSVLSTRQNVLNLKSRPYPRAN